MSTASYGPKQQVTVILNEYLMLRDGDLLPGDHQLAVLMTEV